ncbi:MAG: serine hydrolase domain-containing protein [Acidimicrobiales bacterium]
MANEVATTLHALGEEATRSFPLPGGVVTIIDRGGVVGQTTFGYADLERSIAMPVDGRFQIGSISKVFTSLVVNQLVDEGQLRFEETLGDVLKWPYFGPAMSAITIEELLTHTSGLPAGADALADDAAEIWNVRGHETNLASRGHFHYSNIGYQLLGEIVRERTGHRLSDLVYQRWLVPLGMANASGEVTYADRASLVPGYWPMAPEHPWAPGDPLAPATLLETDSASGNVIATSDDMSRLVMALIGANSGDPVLDNDGAALITGATLQRMTTRLALEGEPTMVPSGLAPVEQSRYGLGINVESIEDHHCLSHGGGMVGYSTFMLVDCTSAFGVVVLTNANGDTLAAQLLARVAHAQFARGLAGLPPLDDFSMDATVRGAGSNESLGSNGVGSFVSDHDGSLLEIVDPGEGLALVVRFEGVDGRLSRRPTGRFVTNHPRLRRYYLDRAGTGDVVSWFYGKQEYSPVASGSLRSVNLDQVNPLVGHYRSYSPWFPEFRIFDRGGILWLSAPGGVEAPCDDEELTEIENGILRVGSDPTLPERLLLGPIRQGEVVSVNRDGCWYSRVFSP